MGNCSALPPFGPKEFYEPSLPVAKIFLVIINSPLYLFA